MSSCSRLKLFVTQEAGMSNFPDISLIKLTEQIPHSVAA